MLKAIFEIREGEKAKYYRGVLSKLWKSPGNNIIIELENAEILHMKEGYIVSKKCHHNPSRFIVPKRRQRLIREINELGLGTKIVIKLLYETRSGKFAVSSVGA